MGLNREFIMELNVECDKGLDVGKGPDGYLRVIGITGGKFTGKVCGTIVPGGADWSMQKEEHVFHVFARYLLQTNDGEYIAIENVGVIDCSDDSSIIRTTPRFTASKNGKYGWLNYGIYVGSLEASKVLSGVNIKIYKML